MTLGLEALSNEIFGKNHSCRLIPKGGISHREECPAQDSMHQMSLLEALIQENTAASALKCFLDLEPEVALLILQGLSTLVWISLWNNRCLCQRNDKLGRTASHWVVITRGPIQYSRLKKITHWSQEILKGPELNFPCIKHWSDHLYLHVKCNLKITR